MADEATEYTAVTAEHALLDSLRDEYECSVYELREYAAYMGEDPADAAVDFDASGVPEAIRLICADPDLRGLAVRDHTKITTSVASGVPLIEFDNGGEVPIYDEDWAFDPDFPAFDPDFPIGTAIVVYGSTVASATTAKARTCARNAEHRRAEAAYFRAEAHKCESRECAFVLEELANVCEADASTNDEGARRIDTVHVQVRNETRVRQVLASRAFVGRRGQPGRRLDRRLGCGRARGRALVRSSSRGGDSGDPDLADERPGHKPPSLQGAVA